MPVIFHPLIINIHIKLLDIDYLDWEVERHALLDTHNCQAAIHPGICQLRFPTSSGQVTDVHSIFKGLNFISASYSYSGVWLYSYCKYVV